MTTLVSLLFITMTTVKLLNFLYTCTVAIVVVICVYHIACSIHNSLGPPSKPMSVESSVNESTNQTFIVRWDKVNDFFTITYMVTWTNESYTNSSNTAATSLTVTDRRLTANTAYNVTVTAINTCCGAGPTSDVILARTNLNPPTPPPTMTTTSGVNPNSTATSGMLFTCTVRMYIQARVYNVQSSLRDAVCT